MDDLSVTFQSSISGPGKFGLYVYRYYVLEDNGMGGSAAAQLYPNRKIDTVEK